MLVQRFLREMEIVDGSNDPHVVTVYGAGEVTGSLPGDGICGRL